VPGAEAEEVDDDGDEFYSEGEIDEEGVIEHGVLENSGAMMGDKAFEDDDSYTEELPPLTVRADRRVAEEEEVVDFNDGELLQVQSVHVSDAGMSVVCKLDESGSEKGTSDCDSDAEIEEGGVSQSVFRSEGIDRRAIKDNIKRYGQIACVDIPFSKTQSLILFLLPSTLL
jgi:hypothetical protein